MNLNKLQSKIQEMEDKISPEQKMEVRFTMDRSEIDESLSNVHWVLLDLANPSCPENRKS